MDTILFTASTDNSGGVNPVSVPAANNPYLPAIDPGVTLNPNPALLDGNSVGPLGGITYGPFAFGANTGGTTGFVHVSYTLPATGLYQLFWEASDAIDHSRPSALGIDNVKLGNTLLFGFEAGIPAGFTAQGSVGTSSAVSDLAPTQGSSFAYLDTTGNVPATYDTVDGTEGSQLTSSAFSVAGPRVNRSSWIWRSFPTTVGHSTTTESPSCGAYRNRHRGSPLRLSYSWVSRQGEEDNRS